MGLIDCFSVILPISVKKHFPKGTFYESNGVEKYTAQRGTRHLLKHMNNDSLFKELPTKK